MKTYTEEFKKTIVELYEAGNKTKSELTREYGTSEANVRTWIKNMVQMNKFRIFEAISVYLHIAETIEK